jgi:hypothetical protein
MKTTDTEIKKTNPVIVTSNKPNIKVIAEKIHLLVKK